MLTYWVSQRNIPEKTIQRLLLYYRYLNFLLQQGTKNISSKSLADLMEIRDSQVRKDLSYFGEFGVRGIGYSVEDLLKEIRNQVVREGITSDISLEECRDCHTDRSRFCNQCHNIVNLNLDCFGCHNYPETAEDIPHSTQSELDVSAIPTAQVPGS